MSRGAVLLAVAFATAATLLFSERFTRQMRDFEVYRTAAVRARAGEPLYRTSDQHYQFKYLPAFAVLTTPLATLPLPQAKRIWFGCSVALLVVLVSLSLALPTERRTSSRTLALVTIVVMGKFYGHELVLGQVNLLFGVLVVSSLLALRRRREATAGLLLATAIVVKPYGVLFLPWLAAVRRLRAAAAVAAGLALAVALPAVTYGAAGSLAIHREWWTTVTATTAPNLLNQDNVSLAAMWARWLGPGTMAQALAAGSGVILLLAFVWIVLARRRVLAFPEALEGTVLLVLVPLLSPQGWDYVFLIATPAVVLIVNYRDALPPFLRALALTALPAIGLSLFDVMGRANYARFMSWSVITVCFLILVAALAELRRRGLA